MILISIASLASSSEIRPRFDLHYFRAYINHKPILHIALQHRLVSAVDLIHRLGSITFDRKHRVHSVRLGAPDVKKVLRLATCKSALVVAAVSANRMDSSRGESAAIP